MLNGYFLIVRQIKPALPTAFDSVTRMAGLSDQKSLIPFSVLIHTINNCDGQTDGQTYTGRPLVTHRRAVYNS